METIGVERKKRSIWRTLWVIFTVLSVIANFVLLLSVMGLAALFATGPRGSFAEEIIKKGARETRIAIIDVKGIIAEEAAANFGKQIKLAREDETVKGLIVRVDSPGGTISASDAIYNAINKYKKETKEPVIAFMTGMAASGGYYASVACDKIMAEPTTITGSIGVIVNYFVLEGLLKNKLGIEPVVVKSGEKKDWPSIFRPPSEEQNEYLDAKLIKPAYERFVSIVEAGRPQIESEEVRSLADGSIYGASEAVDNKLIDGIGYLDDAIDMISKLSGVTGPEVIRYKKLFSLSGFLGAQAESNFKMDRNTLYELGTPQALYLWTGQ